MEFGIEKREQNKMKQLPVNIKNQISEYLYCQSCTGLVIIFLFDKLSQVTL